MDHAQAFHFIIFVLGFLVLFSNEKHESTKKKNETTIRDIRRDEQILRLAACVDRPQSDDLASFYLFLCLSIDIAAVVSEV